MTRDDTITIPRQLADDIGAALWAADLSDHPQAIRFTRARLKPPEHSTVF